MTGHPLIAVTDTSTPRDPARWDLVSGDISRALGAPAATVQVLSVHAGAAGYLVHVQIKCLQVSADAGLTSTERAAT